MQQPSSRASRSIGVVRRRLLRGAGALCAAALTPVARAQPAKSLRIGVTTRAESSEGRGAQHFAEQLGSLSQGKLKAECLYNSDGGKLNDAKGTMYTALMDGRVNIVVAPTTQAVDAIKVKELELWDMPFMFSNFKEVDTILDGPIGRKVLDKLPAVGMQGLLYMENGFRQFCSTTKPLETIPDFAGVKIRVIPTPIYMAIFKALGAEPVSVPFDKVYDMFKSKDISAAEISFGPAYDKKWHEFLRYFTISNYIYSPYLVSSSLKWWEALAVEERQMINTALISARGAQSGFARQTEADTMNAMKAGGVDVRALSRQQSRGFSERLARISSNIANDIGLATWIEVNTTLNRMRGS